MQEEKNTITFLFRFFFKKVKRRRNRLSLGHTTYLVARDLVKDKILSNGEELIETLTLVLVLLQWPYLWYPVKMEYKFGLKQSVTQYTRISLLHG